MKRIGYGSRRPDLERPVERRAASPAHTTAAAMAADGPLRRALDAPEREWRAAWEAWAAEESDLPVGRRVWP